MTWCNVYEYWDEGGPGGWCRLGLRHRDSHGTWIYLTPLTPNHRADLAKMTAAELKARAAWHAADHPGWTEFHGLELQANTVALWARYCVTAPETEWWRRP